MDRNAREILRSIRENLVQTLGFFRRLAPLMGGFNGNPQAMYTTERLDELRSRLEAHGSTKFKALLHDTTALLLLATWDRRHLASTFPYLTSATRVLFFGKAREFFDQAHDDFEYEYFTVVPGSLPRRCVLYISFFTRFVWMFLGTWLTYFTVPPFNVVFKFIGGGSKDD